MTHIVPRIVSWCQNVRDRVYEYLTISPTTNWTFISSGIVPVSSKDFTGYSGFRGRPVFSSVRGIETFNDYRVIVWILQEH